MVISSRQSFLISFATVLALSMLDTIFFMVILLEVGDRAGAQPPGTSYMATIVAGSGIRKVSVKNW